MSGKQRRGPEQRPEAQSAPTSDGPTSDVGAGNAAFAERLGESGEGVSVRSEVAVGPEVVRDIASPIVERGRLALELTPIAPETLARFVDVLARSRLDPEQRGRLIDKLTTDDAAARGIADAVARGFPGDTRAALGELLGAVDRALAQGVAEGSGWRFGAVLVPLPEASAAASADRLVAGLADQLVSADARDSLGEAPGERLTRYCHSVSMLLVWEEEEEEDLAVGVDVELA